MRNRELVKKILICVLVIEIILLLVFSILKAFAERCIV